MLGVVSRRKLGGDRRASDEAYRFDGEAGRRGRPRLSGIPRLSRGIAARVAPVLALLLPTLTPAEARAECPAQLSPTWNRRINIMVENPGPTREAILLAKINTKRPVETGAMRPDGADVRILTSSCVPVPFWIEGGLGTPETKIWMRVPSLANGRSQIDLYYGASSAPSASSIDDVFGAGLVTLFTFTENGGGTVFDRVGSNDLGMTATWTDGPLPGVGAATGFGATKRLYRADGGPALGSGSFTVLSFVNPSHAGLNIGLARGIIGSYHADDEPGWVLKLQGAEPENLMFLTNAGDVSEWCQGSGHGNVPDGTWSLVGARRRAGVTNELLVNGTVVFEGCPGDTRNVDGPGPFEIGNAYNGNISFSGSISMSFIWARALSDDELLGLDGALRSVAPPSVLAAGAPPAPPVIGVATPNGSTSVTITFSPPEDVGDAPIIEYEAVCAPFGRGRGAGSPLTVGGLAPGMEHKCAVRAVNAFGPGPWSTDTNTFIAGDAPSIGSPATARFVVGREGSFTIVATGAPEPVVTVKGTLPPGLTVNGPTISGVPPLGSVGVYPLEVSAANGVAPPATQALALEVVKASQRIDFLPVPPQTLRPQLVELDVSATSGLPVALESLSPSVCSVTGTSVQMLAAGVCAIRASQDGDANFEPAPPVTMSFQIMPGVSPSEDGGASETDASAPEVDAGTDAGSPPVPPPSTEPPPAVVTPPSSSASGLEDGAVEGGGCVCAGAGAPVPAGALAIAVAGLVAFESRRRRRASAGSR